MIKRTKYLGGAVIVLSVVSIFSFSTSASFPSLKTYEESTNLEIKQGYLDMNEEDLLNEVNKVSEIAELTMDETILYELAHVLDERKEEFSELEIADYIQDESNLETSKIIMTDLLSSKSEKKNNKEIIKSLILDKKLEKNVKAKIIISSDFEPKDIGLLKEIYENEEGNLAFQSLKKISHVDPEIAYGIAKTTLKSSEKDKVKVSAALKATSNFLKEKGQDSAYNREIKDFTKHSLTIYNEDSDELLKDSAFFAVSDLAHKEAISEIIKDEKIETVLKRYAIDQNYLVLEKMLLDAQSTEEINLVLDAIQILPLNNFKEHLKSLDSTHFDGNTFDRIESLLNLIEKEGIEATI